MDRNENGGFYTDNPNIVPQGELRVARPEDWEKPLFNRMLQYIAPVLPFLAPATQGRLPSLRGSPNFDNMVAQHLMKRPQENWGGWSEPSTSIIGAKSYDYMPTPRARGAREGVVSMPSTREVPNNAAQGHSQRFASVDDGFMAQSSPSGMSPGFLTTRAQNANAELTPDQLQYLNAMLTQQLRGQIRVVP